MITCISSCSFYADETLNTLRLAQRAIRISNCPKVNTRAQPILELQATINRLNQQLHILSQNTESNLNVRTDFASIGSNYIAPFFEGRGAMVCHLDSFYNE